VAISSIDFVVVSTIGMRSRSSRCSASVPRSGSFQAMHRDCRPPFLADFTQALGIIVRPNSRSRNASRMRQLAVDEIIRCKR